MKRPIPRKVKEQISENEIMRDLKRYQEAALGIEGITDAVIIGRDSIYVDPRVPYKCAIPGAFLTVFVATVLHIRSQQKRPKNWCNAIATAFSSRKMCRLT